MCSWGYFFQFNGEKAWVGVEILCLHFPKTLENKYKIEEKWQPSKIVRLFLIFLTYITYTPGSIKPPCGAPVKKLAVMG